MDPIDSIMQQASEALVQTHYLRCEKLCLEALRLCREGGDYDRLARVLLPLQEARRQRRQAALERGVAVLAEKPAAGAVTALLDRHDAGCLLLVDPPFTADDEHALRRAAVERERMVEVLRLDQARLRSTFEHEMEVLGDAELARLPANLPPAQQVEALSEILERVGDHEIAHQRLAAAARAASHEQAAGGEAKQANRHPGTGQN